MKMRLLRANKVREMTEEIEANLEKYRNGDFGYLDYDTSQYIESGHEIDEQLLMTIECRDDDHREVENCETLFKAMNGLSPYLARDERIWVYLVHTRLLQYSRKRWPIPTENARAVSHIRSHFFVVGSRGFERDNAASRLWWMAALCERAEGLNVHEALTCLLYQYDVRANIIERPTTSQNVRVFSKILAELCRSYNGDRSLFERESFRTFMKRLNLKGGTKLLDILNDAQLDDTVSACIQ